VIPIVHKRLRAILGMSMGGMNAWQWAERYPDQADAIMPVVSMPAPVSGRNLLWRRMASPKSETIPTGSAATIPSRH
jgi:homoserine O-acetyltransferase